MRTLVISDLHIGQPGGTAVLERSRPLQILTDTLAGYDRLVLLGDTVELTEGHWAHSALTAAPILRRLGQAVGKIVLLPGNHDHPLVEPWAHAQGQALAREASVPTDVSPQLREITGWLGQSGAEVEVRYPGIWLSDTVWATHGHYLNHFLRPVSSFGRLPKEQRATPPPMTPSQFEHVAYSDLRVELTEGPPEPRWHDKLMPRQLAPIISWGLDLQVRRHALPAFGQATVALGIGADHGPADGPQRRAQYAIFGHIHRFGPLPLDNPREWRTADGVQLLNTGAWRYEPVLVGGAGTLHPYWPGGAIAIGEDGIPRPLSLLREVTHAELR